jgi:hypothetical protein
MQMRTRFIIPVEGAAADPPPTPQFDSVTANSARPVRPIVESEETQVARRPAEPPAPVDSPAPYQAPPLVMYSPQTIPAAVRRRSPWRAVLITFLIVGAVGIGLAGGYGYAHYSELTTPEPIAAAAELRERTSQPDPAFTMPPEETVDEPVVFDPNADRNDPDADNPDDLPPGQPPRVTRDPGATVSPPRDNQRYPADDPEGTRQRRVDPENDQRTANRRHKNSTSTEETTGQRIRRTGNGIADRIRQIFEGKP